MQSELKNKKSGRKSKKTDMKNTEPTNENEYIKCTLCEEDLISFTEDDTKKNIRCDYCTSWYHLKCTAAIWFSKKLFVRLIGP